MPDNLRLYYSHDPMCSFCWAFRPVWTEIQSRLEKTQPEVQIIYIMGGLAPDSDAPMPETMRDRLQATWRYIEQHIPGTRFNYDFWSTQTPRRSTYPACRAVIAARMMNPDLEDKMILAIQQAYYLNALNPSNEDTLIDCARSIGLDSETFSRILHSEACNAMFEKSRALSGALGIMGFPALVVTRGDSRYSIPPDYNQASAIMDKLNQAISLLHP